MRLNVKKIVVIIFFISVTASVLTKVSDSLFNKDNGNQVEENIIYGNSTLKEAGGLLLCLQKTEELLGNERKDIQTYIDFSVSNGYKLEQLGTNYKMIEAYCSANGLGVEEIERTNKEKLIEALNGEHPVIMLCGNGNFTSTGKYILIYEIIDENNIKVYDPSSEQISKMSFSIDYIINNSSKALSNEISYWEIKYEE